MQNRLRGTPKFDTVEKGKLLVPLLVAIRTISYSFDANVSKMDALSDALQDFNDYKQEFTHSNARHMREFKALVSAIEQLDSRWSFLWIVF